MIRIKIWISQDYRSEWEIKMNLAFLFQELDSFNHHSSSPDLTVFVTR